MNAQHTPAPWHWDGDGFNSLFDAKGRMLLYYTNRDDGVHCENEFDASLIAAAPELLDVLQGIKWKSADRDNMEFSALITYSQMDAIRIAIANATGTPS